MGCGRAIPAGRPSAHAANIRSCRPATFLNINVCRRRGFRYRSAAIRQIFSVPIACSTTIRRRLIRRFPRFCRAVNSLPLGLRVGVSIPVPRSAVSPPAGTPAGTFTPDRAPARRASSRRTTSTRTLSATVAASAPTRRLLLADHHDLALDRVLLLPRIVHPADPTAGGSSAARWRRSTVRGPRPRTTRPSARGCGRRRPGALDEAVGATRGAVIDAEQEAEDGLRDVGPGVDQQHQELVGQRQGERRTRSDSPRPCFALAAPGMGRLTGGRLVGQQPRERNLEQPDQSVNVAGCFRSLAVCVSLSFYGYRPLLDSKPTAPSCGSRWREVVTFPSRWRTAPSVRAAAAASRSARLTRGNVAVIGSTPKSDTDSP